MKKQRKQKQVEAPAVIIAPEHQSAPKDDWRPSINSARSGGLNSDHSMRMVHTEDTDIMGHEPDPILDAKLAGMRERCMDRSPSQTVEAALEQYEKNYHLNKQFRWQGQERWQGKENEEMRMVRIMHPHSFIRRLKQAGIAASYDEHILPPPGARIWLNNFARAGRVGVNAWMPNTVKGCGMTAETVTTLQYPFGPEWSIMRFDDYNVPTNERYRGWRTTLLTLIIGGVLTEDEAHRAFGDPQGPAALFYREQLYTHRAISRGLRTKESAA